MSGTTITLLLLFFAVSNCVGDSNPAGECGDGQIVGVPVLPLATEDVGHIGRPSKGKTYVVLDSRFRIPCCGVVQEWRFVPSGTGLVYLQIWRGNESTYSFTSQNILNVTDINTNSFVVPVAQRIQVTGSGDEYIGWYSPELEVVGQTKVTSGAWGFLASTSRIDEGRPYSLWADRTGEGKSDRHFIIQAVLTPDKTACGREEESTVGVTVSVTDAVTKADTTRVLDTTRAPVPVVERAGLDIGAVVGIVIAIIILLIIVVVFVYLKRRRKLCFEKRSDYDEVTTKETGDPKVKSNDPSNGNVHTSRDIEANAGYQAEKDKPAKNASVATPLLNDEEQMNQSAPETVLTISTTGDGEYNTLNDHTTPRNTTDSNPYNTLGDDAQDNADIYDTPQIKENETIPVHVNRSETLDSTDSTTGQQSTAGQQLESESQLNNAPTTPAVEYANVSKTADKH